MSEEFKSVTWDNILKILSKFDKTFHHEHSDDATNNEIEEKKLIKKVLSDQLHLNLLLSYIHTQLYILFGDLNKNYSEGAKCTEKIFAYLLKNNGVNLNHINFYNHINYLLVQSFENNNCNEINETKVTGPMLKDFNVTTDNVLALQKNINALHFNIEFAEVQLQRKNTEIRGLQIQKEQKEDEIKKLQSQIERQQNGIEPPPPPHTGGLWRRSAALPGESARNQYKRLQSREPAARIIHPRPPPGPPPNYRRPPGIPYDNHDPP